MLRRAALSWRQCASRILCHHANAARRSPQLSSTLGPSRLRSAWVQATCTGSSPSSLADARGSVKLAPLCLATSNLCARPPLRSCGVLRALRGMRSCFRCNTISSVACRCTCGFCLARFRAPRRPARASRQPPFPPASNTKPMFGGRRSAVAAHSLGPGLTVNTGLTRRSS